MPKTTHVSITYEQTRRVCKEYDVTDDQLMKLKNGDISDFEKDLEKDLPAGDEEWDYAVDDDCGRTIVPWKN